MSTIVMWFKRTWLIGTIVSLGLVSLPMANAYALGLPDPVTPPAPTGISTDRLEQVWAREQTIYNRLGIFFDNVDQRISKGQELIDKAKANGKDVSALQAALDAFSDAVKQARPIYQSANGIVSSHQGFDANGMVTDQEKAVQTVKDLGGKFKEIRQILLDPGKALRQAIKAFREANRPSATPVPAQTGN